jgi:hypothetical protein
MSFIDTFGDAAQKAYFDQIENIRRQLMKDGPSIDYGRKSDQELLVYQGKVKVLTTIFQQLHKHQKRKSDKKIGEYYTRLDDHSEAILDNTGLIPNPSPDKTTSDFPITSTGATSQPDNVKENYKIKIEREEKVKKYFEENNANVYKTPFPTSKFPEPGQEVEGHDRAKSTIIANQKSVTMPNQNGGKQTLFKSWSPMYEKIHGSTHGTPSEPYTDKINNMIEEHRKSTPGSYRFFIEKLHGKSIDGSFFKKNPITPGKTADELPNRMVFPAYVEEFNDSYTVDWSGYNFIGRSEEVKIYNKTSRTMQLGFWMMSDFSVELLIRAVETFERLTNPSKNKNGSGRLDDTVGSNVKTAHAKAKGLYDKASNELNPGGLQEPEEIEMLREAQRVWMDWGSGTTPNPSFVKGSRAGFVGGQFSGTPELMWVRSTFLAQCCYPWYRKDGKMKEQPFVRIRLGDFFDVVAVIRSLNFSQDQFDMDLNPSSLGAVPMAVKVTMNLDIVHENEPHSDYPFFYHRKDFDAPSVTDEKPEALSETSKTKDSSMDKNKSKSPVSSISSLTNHGKAATSFPNDTKAVQESLQNFGSSVNALQSSMSNLNDLKKVATLKESLANAKRLLDVTKEADTLMRKDRVPEDKYTPREGEIQNSTDVIGGKMDWPKAPLFPQFKKNMPPPPSETL